MQRRPDLENDIEQYRVLADEVLKPGSRQPDENGSLLGRC